MNKKGTITVLIIIVLIIIGYAVWGGSSTPSTAPIGGSTSTTTGSTSGASAAQFAPVTSATADQSLLGRLKGVSVSAAETGSRVALVNGKAQFSADGVTGSIALGDIAVAEAVGNANYVITTLGVTSGGTTAQYAVLFTDTHGALADQSYDLIGSGVTVTGLRADAISGGLAVTVSFTDASGASHKKIMVIDNGAFDSAKDINI